jgi:hypothetical protein
MAPQWIVIMDRYDAMAQQFSIAAMQIRFYYLH